MPSIVEINGVTIIKLRKLATFDLFTPAPLKYTLISIQNSR
jgi:hypothetical protein